MKFGLKRRERVGSVLEKIGAAWFLAGSGDIFFTHKASLWLDFVVILSGLTLILLSVIIAEDEPE